MKINNDKEFYAYTGISKRIDTFKNAVYDSVLKIGNKTLFSCPNVPKIFS